MYGVEAGIRAGDHADNVYPTGTDGRSDPPEHLLLGLVDANERVTGDNRLHLDEDDA